MRKRVRLRPCAAGEYGAIVATGTSAGDRTVTRPWAAVGAGGRFELTLVGPFELDAAADGYITLERNRFFIGEADIFEIPLVVGQGTLGLGVSLP
ncbi:MAG: hypothetical protein ABSC94_09570 [Polyangiaceae bacterium]